MQSHHPRGLHGNHLTGSSRYPLKTPHATFQLIHFFSRIRPPAVVTAIEGSKGDLLTSDPLGMKPCSVSSSPARPLVSLPDTATVTEGAEKTLQCDITGYYPEKIGVTWHIQNGSHSLLAGVNHLSRVCTEVPVHNPDGTYNIRSGVTLHSSAVKDGVVRIICQVEHQTYSRPINRSVALTLQGDISPSPSAG